MQRINLKLRLPKSPSRRLPMQQIVRWLSMYALALCAISLYYGGLYAYENRTLNSWIQQENELSNTLSSLAQHVPQGAQKLSIEQQIDLLTQTLHQKTQTLRFLENLNNTQSRGFYRILSSLASLSVQGIWLKQIDIEESLQHITLSGSMLDRTNLADYTAAVNKLDFFRNKPLTYLKISNQTGKSTDFAISNIPFALPEEKKHA